MSGLTATGWVPKTAAELRSELEASMRAELGDDVDVSAESVFGPVIAAAALKLGELWELAGAVYAARTPSGAAGTALDELAGICPGLERGGSTKGTVTLTVRLAPTVTLPAGARAHVAGETTNAWVTTSAVTNGTLVEDNFTVQAEAIAPGLVRAPTSTISAIATPVSGWLSVTNLADATPGQDSERDAAFRVRRARALQRAGSSPLGALVAQVAEVPGVTQVSGWENTTLHVDADGRPAKSVEVLVVGGDNEAIARAVYAGKAGGIESHGGVAVSFVDDRGITRTARFSRPTDLNVWVTARVAYDAASYAGDDAVKEAILDAAGSLRAGDTARLADLLCAARAVTGLVDVTLLLGLSSTVALQSARNIVPPSPRHRARFDSARITVTRVDP